MKPLCHPNPADFEPLAHRSKRNCSTDLDIGRAKGLSAREIVPELGSDLHLHYLLNCPHIYIGRITPGLSKLNLRTCVCLVLGNSGRSNCVALSRRILHS